MGNRFEYCRAFVLLTAAVDVILVSPVTASKSSDTTCVGRLISVVGLVACIAYMRPIATDVAWAWMQGLIFHRGYIIMWYWLVESIVIVWSSPTVVPLLRIKLSFFASYTAAKTPNTFQQTRSIRQLLLPMGLRMSTRFNIMFSCSVVCVRVGHMDELSKNRWTDRDAVWGLTQVGPKKHV